MKLEFASLLRETLNLLAVNRWRLVPAMLLLTAVPVYADMAASPREYSAFNLLISVMVLFLQIWLTVALLEAHDLRRGNRGVGTVFAIGILSGLGVLAGLILLVVPGLVLFVRWSMSVPYALAEDLGATDSLRASFEETRDSFWPILLLLSACYVPFGIAIAGMALLEADGVTIFSSVLINMLINLALFAGWHASVAVYLAKRGNALPEVFA